ncbi:MAG: MerR family transcriptional regulator [Clostridia bacterium]|jgi:DNA-binding transcriptional MerR regulator|nr:MerR family transcriptional regulator [Clostridia bacterium]
MYSIGMFSKITKITVKALRYYDKVGLLKPERVLDNGYRYYSSEKLFDIQKIISLKQMGFSIKEISNILKANNPENFLLERKNEIENGLKNDTAMLNEVLYYLNNLKENIKMEYQIILKELPEVIVYSKRMRVPNYDAYFELIPEIGEQIKASNPDLKCRVPEYCFIMYYDKQFKENDIDVEFCEAVDKFGVETDSIKFKKMSKVPIAACVMHKGPYSNLRKAYAEVFKWIEDNGYKAIAPARESYIDGIWNKNDEKDWLTEVQVPISKK